MVDTFEMARATFLNYNGTGVYLTLFLVALIYIFVKEDEKRAREAFLYPAVILLVIFFVPFTANIIGNKILGVNVYWRVLWILPVVPLISYVGAKVAAGQKTAVKKSIACVACLLTVIVSGSLVYNASNFQKADNWYKLPPQAVEVSNLIRWDGGESPKAVVANGLIPYIRQYDPKIRLAYGRDIPMKASARDIESLKGEEGLAEKTRSAYYLYGEMNAEQPDVKVLLESSRALGCDYIVVQKDSPLATILGDAGLGVRWIEDTEEYIVYHDDIMQAPLVASEP